MRPSLLAFALAMSTLIVGCKHEDAAQEPRPVRAVAVVLDAVSNDRRVVGEVRPRYESELSFRVVGKVLVRHVDAGVIVHRGDVLAKLDTQDFENRLRSAEADFASADAALIEAQGTEGRQSKLLKDGWIPRAGYDTTLKNLRTAEARVTAAKANLHLVQDQLRYTDLKADFDGVVTAVAVEAGQNVAAGQTVMKLARLDEKDAVFNVAEGAMADYRFERQEAVVWPLANPDLKIDGEVREISPVADATTRTFTVKVALKNAPQSLRLGMTVAGRLKGSSDASARLPLSALFDKQGSPAVWIVNRAEGSVSLRTVAVARYEADAVVIASGLAQDDLVVTAGANTLREGQKVRLPAKPEARSALQ